VSNISIPEQYYVGMVVQPNHPLPLATITPWGEDAAAQKRMRTVDKWCQSSSLSTITLDNVPLSGFRITTHVRRGEYGSSDKWSIEDPRGFAVEILSANMATLMLSVSTENGQILSPCIWGRKAGVNLLLSAEGEDYLNTFAVPEQPDEVLDWKSVRPGFEITLKNGLTGTYLGRVHRIIEQDWDGTQPVNNRFIDTNSMQYAFHVQSTTVTWSKRIVQELHFITSPNLASFFSFPNCEITVAEGEHRINQLLQDPSCYVRSGGNHDVRLAAANPIAANTWSFEIHDLNAIQAVDPWSNLLYDRTVLVQLQDGSWGTVVKDGNSTGKKLQLIDFEGLERGVFAPKASSKPGSGLYKPKVITVTDTQQVTRVCEITLCYLSRAENLIKTKV
jgi:hypothetical protein